MLLVKNLPASVGDVRDTGSIPGSGRCPRGGHLEPTGTHSSILALRIPWTEEPSGLWSIEGWDRASKRLSYAPWPAMDVGLAEVANF